jgi:hypothetical protein
MIELHKVRVRAALKPRNEPYWGPPLGRGRVLGYRRIDATNGSWVARMRNEHNRKVYQKLGFETAVFGYEDARAAALKWFEGRDAGIDNDEITVAGVVDAFTSLGDGLGEGGGCAAARTVAGTLRKRVETGAATMIWNGNVVNGTVAGFPARSSTAVNSGNLIIGDWSRLTIATWNGGIELTINPFGDPVTAPNNFAKGIIGIRCFCSLDIGLSFPSAFTVATAVT